MLFVALLSGAVGAAERPAVLVLVSYHAGLPWSDGQLEGLRKGLAASGELPELFVEYLDTKRVALAPGHVAAVRSLLVSRHGERQLAAVVVQDDDALDFVLAERKAGGFLHGVPVIFSGIAGRRQAELTLQDRVTGYFDDADIAANITLLRRIRPALSRVVFVHDHSQTGVAQAEAVKQLASRFPGLAFEFLSGQPVATIQARLAALDSGAGVILLTFNIDGAGRVLTHEEASALWVAASPVPVLVKEDVMMVPGAVGGLLVASQRQGELAAGALRRVLSGEDARQIPMAGGGVVPLFNQAALRRFGIAEDLLPPDSIVMGREKGLYQTHPREFALLLGLIAALFGIALLVGALWVRARRQREQAAESERSYSELINATSEAIFIHGPDGTVLDVNDRFCAMYGFSRSEVARLTLADLSEDVPPYAADDARRWLRRAMNEGPQLFEWHARRANGSLFWAEVSLRRTELRGQVRLIAAVRDITARKTADAALRASEARYSLILQRTPVGIVYFDAELRITFCNDRFAALTGSQASEIAGLNLQDLSDQRPVPACSEALAGRQGDYEGPYTTTLGDRQLWVEVRTAPMTDDAGMVVGGIAIFEDVSARVTAEQALRALNDELEQRVRVRTTELSAANEDLRHAMKRIAQSEKLAALGSLVAGIAHELNTPIGNARTVASTLHDHVRDFRAGVEQGGLRRSVLEGFVTASDEAAEMLERNLARASELIGNFKQVAVDQTSTRRRRFDLRQLVDEVLSTLQPKLKRQPHRIEIDVPDGLFMDSYPGPLEQVLTNFVLNSLIHGLEGRQGGCIRIAARSATDAIVIDYSDDGVGMSADAASRAFDPFFTTRLGQGGSGLGLYIVHNLVTGALGGSVTLETAPGQGVRFSLQLPARAPALAGEAAEELLA